MDHRRLRELVRDTARSIVLPRFGKIGASAKSDGSLITEADNLMHQRLVAQLQSRWPDIPVLSEELPTQEQQHILDRRGARFWCLDPLDGTSNFACGVPYFCTSLALVENGRVVIGLVFDPVRDECFYACEGKPAMLNDTPLNSANASTLQPQALDQCMGMIDFKRLDAPLRQKIILNPPYRSQRSFGASALDWCWIAGGRCHIYLHGSQKLWDYAAGHFILQNAGGRCSTISGDTLFRTSLSPRSVIAANTGPLFETWSCWLNNTNRIK